MKGLVARKEKKIRRQKYLEENIKIIQDDLRDADLQLIEIEHSQNEEAELQMMMNQGNRVYGNLNQENMVNEN